MGRTDHALVLVVAHVPVVRSLLGLMLDQLQCRALPVGSSTEASSALAHHAPALILLDGDHPFRDDVAAALSPAPLAYRPPLIALVGGSSLSCPGCADQLAKPVQIGGLRRVLERWLGRAEPQPVPAGPCAAALDMGELRRLELRSPGSGTSLLREFLAGLPEAEAGLAAALAAGDASAIIRIAHRLKGSAWCIGATELGNAMDAVDRAARAGAMQELRAGWSVVRSAIIALRCAIAEAGPVLAGC